MTSYNSETQQTLGSFTDSEDSCADNTDTDSSPSTTPQEETPQVPSWSVPADYPSERISDICTDTFEGQIHTPDGERAIPLSTLAGQGGFGKGEAPDNAEEVNSVLKLLSNSPVYVTGGGMQTPMGDGAVFARLEGSQYADGGLKVDITRLWAVSRPTKYTSPSNRRNRTLTIGSYKIAVPRTGSGSQALADTITAFHNGTLRHIDPSRHQVRQQINSLIPKIKFLSPGDIVDTPEYSTPLLVRSHVYETSAIRKTARGKRTERVRAVTVSNPRGGFYNLGFERKPDPSRKSPSLPSCYLSRSQPSPPHPNVPFSVDSAFSVSDVAFESGTTEEPIIGPDTTHADSPLPHPKVQTPLGKIDGIGEKTVREIFTNVETEYKISAEVVAHDYFVDNRHLGSSLHTIIQTLSSLPRSEEIFSQLENYIPEECD